MADLSPETAAQLQTLEKSYADNPARFFVPYAGLLREAGDPAQAEEILRENLKRFSGLSAHVLLGRCLADRGAHEEAANEFHYVLSIDSQNLIALRTLAEMSVALGRRDEAQRWYRDLLSVDPMNDDARAALARLEEAAPDAGSADQPLGGPDGWPGAAEASGDPAGHGAEPPEAEWGNLELASSGGHDDDETRGGVRDEFDAFGFGGVELTEHGRVDDPSDPEPDGSDTAEDDGNLPLLDFAPEAEAEADAEPPFLEADADAEPGDLGVGAEMVTETMAELYASQGLHERAAEMYRELIQRRGEEPALRERLDGLERLIATGVDEAGPDQGEASAITPDWLERIDSGSAGEPYDDDAVGIAAYEAEAPAIAPDAAGATAGPADPAADAWSGGDPFATSVSFGFTGEAEPDAAGDRAGSPPEAGYDLVVIEDTATLDGDDPPPSSVEREGEASAAGALADVPLDGIGGELPDPGHAEVPRTMRAYLASLLEWTRSGPAIDGNAAAAPVGFDATEPVDDHAEPVAEEGLPWELPHEPDAAPELEVVVELEEVAPATATEFSFENFFTPADAAADEPRPDDEPESGASFDPAPPRGEAAGPGEAPAAGAEAARDGDEDLESFQAWLQSLKR